MGGLISGKDFLDFGSMEWLVTKKIIYIDFKLMNMIWLIIIKWVYKKFNHLSLIAKWFNKRWRSCKKALFLIDDCNHEASDQCCCKRKIFLQSPWWKFICPRSGVRTILDWWNLGLFAPRSGDGWLSGQTRRLKCGQF